MDEVSNALWYLEDACSTPRRAWASD